MGRPSAFTLERRQQERERQRAWDAFTDDEKDARIRHQQWVWMHQGRAQKALAPYVMELIHHGTLQATYCIGCEDGTVRVYIKGVKRTPQRTHGVLTALQAQLVAAGYVPLHQFTTSRASRPGGVLHHTRYVTQLVLESPLPVYCKACDTPIVAGQPGATYCTTCSNRLNGVPQ